MAKVSQYTHMTQTELEALELQYRTALQNRLVKGFTSGIGAGATNLQKQAEQLRDLEAHYNAVLSALHALDATSWPDDPAAGNMTTFDFREFDA
jgi:hypothetical protein